MNSLISPVPRQPIAQPLTMGARLARWIKRSLFALLIGIAVISMSGFVYQVVATASDARAFPPPGQMVDVGGYKLHIYCMGTGSPTIVTENGFGGTLLDWSLVQPALSENRRVCSYDRAGFGWSEVGPSPRTSEQIAHELHRLLANSHVEGPYVLVGHSAGAMHSQTFASLYPNEVAGLVLIDPTPAQLMASFSAEERSALMPNLSQMRLLRFLATFGIMRFMPLPGAEALAPLAPMLQRASMALRVKTGAVFALYEEAASFETSILQTAAADPFPPERPLIIIWHGIPVEPVALDPVAQASLLELVERSDNGKFIIAEKSGHYITIEQPDVVIDAVRQVIEAVNRGQPLSR